MNMTIHMPVHPHERTKAMVRKATPGRISIRRARSAQIAHELKNCMSVLILGVASLEYAAQQSMIPTLDQETVEKTVNQMSGLIDELVQMVDGGPGSEGAANRFGFTLGPRPSN